MPYGFHRTRPLCRFTLQASILAVLSGCKESLLNPAGPIADAERIILLDSVVIIHLVFFLHITTDPDNTNNVLGWPLASSLSAW